MKPKLNFSPIFLILCLCTCALCFSLSAKTAGKLIKPRPEIHWLTLDQALALNKTAPRKIYIDIYTNWCGWCKKMDQDCFTNEKVVEEMNKNYYAVKFDAETRQDVVFNGVSYPYSSQQRANQFAIKILDGQMGYPTAVILSEDQSKITQVPGYQKPAFLVEILAYFGNNIHLKESWDTYERELKSK